ncbi:MAG: hydrogenase expression/formation protein HypE [Clostridiales bacterium]|jgi:hydrogenase expression/formation protein HypE|nr:hydrogenase expression/formation protein HypE [Clostridiales bacterium]MDR2713016.1 hydrogenase expression/formation protein HypE [Clostridiales bacterium]
MDKSSRILLAHGSGGLLYRRLVEEVLLPYFTNPILSQLGDAALCDLPSGRLALTCDSFVVKPLFFPGGDIGRLAVCGTVNDLAMSGARPLYLTLGLIIEEGFLMADLQRICASIAQAAQEAGVSIITGDTKVVGKGQADGIFINTAGVGVVASQRDLSRGPQVQPGDKVLLTGSLAQHGMAVMAAREELAIDPPLVSDVAPLPSLTDAIFKAAPGIKLLRDPTRGGVAATLSEWAESTGLSICLEEAALPLERPVAALCELLGLDPLYVANEGKFLAAVPPKEEKAALAALRAHPLGRQAACIGAFTDEPGAKVSITTPYGGRRLVGMISGEQLPRIC